MIQLIFQKNFRILFESQDHLNELIMIFLYK